MTRSRTNNALPSVGVAVITHCAKNHLSSCLPPLLNSPVRPRVLVVNSSSGDGTVEEAERLGAETLIIPRCEFNHGLTRERARKHLGTDIVVMITPDAYPVDDSALGTLIAPIVQEKASVSYGRQLPRDGAGLFERFARQFNYPDTEQLRSIEDINRYGVYTFFCSNSWSAWRNDALCEIGGFSRVLLGEDTVACARLLRRGHKVAYVATSKVKHSHGYSLWQEFRRHFDTGIARKHCQELIGGGGADEKRGTAYAKTLLAYVAARRPHLVPYAFCHLAAKWLGYRFGRALTDAPVAIKRACSLQDFYWSSTPEVREARVK